MTTFRVHRQKFVFLSGQLLNMADLSASAAAKPNKALEPLSILIGEWSTAGKHPLIPGITFHGRASFKWLAGGAFVMMHSEMSEKEIPAGIAIFGSDDSIDEYTMLYFDERGVSRKYLSTLENNTWKWWRPDPGFSQRFTGTIIDDGHTIIGKGEMSRNGAPWEDDLELIYTRIR